MYSLYNLEKLHQYLYENFKKYFSEWQNLKITDLEDITSGWEADLFSFQLEYEINGNLTIKDFVLRIHSGTIASNKTEREYFILQKLIEVNFFVPKVFFMDLNLGKNKSGFVMEKIMGENMGLLILAFNSEEQKNQLLKLFIKIFTQLHKLNWEIAVKDTNLYENAPITYFIEKKIDTYQNQITRYNLHELIPIISWLKENMPEDLEIHLAINHNDFHPHNILLTNDNKLFIIDWTAYQINDYRFDLAWTLVLFYGFMGQSHRDLILKMYKKNSQKDISHIEYFEVFAILRRLSDILMVLTKASQTIGLRENSREKILESKNHIFKLLELLEKRTESKYDELRTLIDSLV